MSDLDIEQSDLPEISQEQNRGPSPGQTLKRLREELGLSHARVAESLHLTVRYVKALENDEYQKLPGKIFVKGYFKSYAMLVKADVEDIVACYEQFSSVMEESVESEAKVLRVRKVYDQNLRWLVGAATIIVFVLVISWWFNRGDGAANGTEPGLMIDEVLLFLDVEDDPEAATAEALLASREPAPEPFPEEQAEDSIPFNEFAQSPESVSSEVEIADTDTEDEAVNILYQSTGEVPSAVPGSNISNSTLSSSIMPGYEVEERNGRRIINLDGDGDDVLQMHFTGTSWIEVDDILNVRLYNDNLHEGDELTIKGEAPFDVLIGDANMVEVVFNSRVVDVVSSIRSDSSTRIYLEP